MKSIFKYIITSIVIVLFFSGCSSRPTHMELTIKSMNNLNPNIKNVSSPLMLTFYELESAEMFLKYDYWTILSDSGKNLGTNLISQAKHIITPNQEQQYNIVFDKKAKFLGIVGKFRSIKNKKDWKTVINLEEDNYNENLITIDKFKIQRVE